MDHVQIRELGARIKENISKVVVGKEEVVDLLLVALISSGHALLEDVPGTGKTLLAKALASSVRLKFKRIQFTPDLMPSDLSGIHFYNQKLGDFEFRAGPVFSNILLADEINRATPRTQSSLLECMEERQVTVDGYTMKLDRPFMVVATQNPIENQGTFPLPEAQLDRFMIKVQMNYPDRAGGVEILKRFRMQDPLEHIKPVADAEEIMAAQQAYSGCVFVADDLLDYMVQIAEKTRSHSDIALGVSPRGTQALLRASQVYAILQGRDYVSPDDVKAMLLPVFAHRVQLKTTVRMKQGIAGDVLQDIIREVPVPAEQHTARL